MCFQLTMIIAVPVCPLRNPAESPAVRLSHKGRKLGMFEVSGYHPHLELTGLEDTKGSTMRSPCNDVGEIRAAQDSVHLRGEVGDPTRRGQGREGVVVFHLGEVNVIEERCLAELPSLRWSVFGFIVRIGHSLPDFSAEFRGLLHDRFFLSRRATVASPLQCPAQRSNG